MKSVYVVCATGIATSSMLRVKIQDFLDEKGLKARVTNYRVTELNLDRIDADVIVATTGIPSEIREAYECIDGVSLLTGIGEQEVFDALEKALRK